MPPLSRTLLSAILALLLGFLAPLAARAEFSHGPTVYEAGELARKLAGLRGADGRGARWYLRQGQRLSRGGEASRDAYLAFLTAAAIDPSLQEAYRGVAEMALAISATSPSEQFELQRQATAAAFQSYRLAKTPAEKSSALALLATAYEQRSLWRPAIDALKEATSLEATPELVARYEELRAEQGFRIADYSVESDAASPRVCVQFTEPLARGKQDFAKFFSVDGRDPAAVRTDTQQACLEGLEHGKRYEITVRAGLPSSVGEDLLKTATLAVYVRDRSPGVRFGANAYVLANRGQQGIPVISVNTDAIEVEVFRIGDRGLARAVIDGDFQRALSGWQSDELADRHAARVWQGSLEVRSELNEDVTTAFPLNETVGQLQPGVYVMVARAAGKTEDTWSERATQWFVVSDLGLMALQGGKGVHAFVRSLATAEPVAGATVRLVARNNEVLGEASSDASGHVHFAGGLATGKGGMAPAVLIAENGPGDFAFLDLTANAFDLTDRGVAGRAQPGPLDGFLFAERGVYRPGETVHLTALLRRDDTTAAPSMPVTLVVTRPDGVEHAREAVADMGAGGRTLDLALPAAAMTGTWSVAALADPKAPALATTAFLVEDFVPERLGLELDATDPTVAASRAARLAVAGRYLYGAPAAGLRLSGDILVRTRSGGLPGYEGFAFGLDDEEFSAQRAELPANLATDVGGTAEITVALPDLAQSSRLLEARVAVTMTEPGGRAITRDIVLPIEPERALVGVRSNFASGEIGAGRNASFDVVTLDAAGRRSAETGLVWTLFRLERHYQWYNRDGSWGYESVTFPTQVASGTLATSPDAPARFEAPVEYGRYRLEVVSATPGGPATGVTFTAGWWSADADTPEVLDVALDKPRYAAGETATLTVASPSAGKLVVAVLGDDVLATSTHDVTAGSQTVSVPVGQDWGAGVYVAAMHYRPMDEAAKRMPSRAIGIRWLALDQAPLTLEPVVTLENQVRGNRTLTVPVSVGQPRPGETVRAVVAAVDVGILSLTRYETPDPAGWFYGQRRLAMDIRDLYGRLIDGMRASRGAVRSGGDGGEGALSMQGSPPVEKPLALFSGIVEVDADGNANVDLDLPPFNGTVRIMVVAWSETRVGSSSRDLIVRDPVTLTLTTPRFLTLGDQARLSLDLHNVDAPSGAFAVRVSAEDADNTSRAVGDQTATLETGARQLVPVLVDARKVGPMFLEVRVSGPGDVDIARRVAIDVKAPAPSVRRQSRQQIAANGGRLTIDAALFGDLIAERSRVTIATGPAALLDVPSILVSLDRYPYGCAEQTTSRALPLLYLSSVSARIGLAGDDAVRARVADAITNLAGMQSSSGEFGLWAPVGGDLWLTSYVTDFLTRAKEEGYAVQDRVLSNALDRLQNFVTYTNEVSGGGGSLAYALYTLARNGRAPIGDLRYYADTKLDEFSSPLAKTHLGAALAMMNDRERAGTVFASALESLQAEELKPSLTRTDYGSLLRDGAQMLTLAGERFDAGLGTGGDIVRLSQLVRRALDRTTHTSTQENAWLLMAARSLLEAADGTRLLVNGEPSTGAYIQGVTVDRLTSEPIRIENRAETPADAVVTVAGEAATPEPAIERGLRVSRAYYGLDGKPIDLASATGGRATLAQNTRIVTVLTVDVADGAGGRLLLEDRLPAGLEIENPKLVDSASLSSFPWLKSAVYPEHTGFRDDRFVASFNLWPGSGSETKRTMTLAYVARAVSPGTFLHPPATVEDMYRPARYARTASGTLEVTAERR
ncbi:MAG: alpha-2-macroglobulin family protein [Rhizobiales bacterium]|nr:alpha-2-macroglobulin family protein [Hyphomicrobiales bacterium]